MVNLWFLPKWNPSAAYTHKCKVCTTSNFVRQPFKSIERSNEVFGLIHIDLCDFKSIPSHGGKNNYITFIDDNSKYCYVY